MLVTFEGLDGSGKTTLIEHLRTKIECISTKEPGSPHIPVNQTIREIVLKGSNLTAFQRELLFAADASIHADWLKKNLNALIFSDRGLCSHLAYLYASLKMRLLSFDEYMICRKLIEKVCLKPDLVIYLQGDLDLMESRLSGGPKDEIESRGSSFFFHVKAAYEEYLMTAGLDVLYLNARNSIEENVKRVLEHLEFINRDLKKSY